MVHYNLVNFINKIKLEMYYSVSVILGVGVSFNQFLVPSLNKWEIIDLDGS